MPIELATPVVDDQGHVTAPVADPPPQEKLIVEGAAKPESIQTAATETDEKPIEITQKTGEVVEFDVKDLERDAEGNFVFQIGSSEGSIYKAKTIPELFTKIKNGVLAKDGTITTLKNERLTADSHKGRLGAKGKEQTAEPQIQIPTREELLNDTMRQYSAIGVKPEMLLWNDADWQNYETNNGSRNTYKLSNAVDRIREVAEQRFQEANIIAINDITLDEETDAVRELLSEAGVTFTEADYVEVLDAVHSKIENFKANGVRKNGVIVKEAMRKITKMVKESATTTAKTKIEEKIAAGKSGKPKGTEGKTGAEANIPATRPAAKNFDLVVENILKETNSKK